MGALDAWVTSSSRTICDSRVSAPTRVTSTSRRPSPFRDAPTTSSPGPTSTGTDSPVSMDRSTEELPLRTSPSAGTFWPGRTTTTSPTPRSSMGTVRSLSPSSSVASRGCRARSLWAASPALSRTEDSRTFPSRISVTIMAATSK